MWLINVKTYRLEYFLHEKAPPYAILSHTWGKDEEELSFRDMSDLENAKHKKGYQKLEFTFSKARQHELDYAWIDTCAIDKSSSAELSEAINSMFTWYQKSRICFVYLEDIISERDPFETSRWWTRGWTLQELLAPLEVHFFDRNGKLMGTKSGELCQAIHNATRIDMDVLMKPHLMFHKPHAVKMHWASARETTRIEDRAYSLLGIFQVNMPLLYGEGTKAFQRLQETILMSSNDLSLLAFDIFPTANHAFLERLERNLHAFPGPWRCDLLAKSPAQFGEPLTSTIKRVGWRRDKSNHVFSGARLEAALPIISMTYGTSMAQVETQIAIIPFTLEETSFMYLGIVLNTEDHSDNQLTERGSLCFEASVQDIKLHRTNVSTVLVPVEHIRASSVRTLQIPSRQTPAFIGPVPITPEYEVAVMLQCHVLGSFPDQAQVQLTLKPLKCSPPVGIKFDAERTLVTLVTSINWLPLGWISFSATFNPTATQQYEARALFWYFDGSALEGGLCAGIALSETSSMSEERLTGLLKRARHAEASIKNDPNHQREDSIIFRLPSGRFKMTAHIKRAVLFHEPFWSLDLVVLECPTTFREGSKNDRFLD